VPDALRSRYIQILLDQVAEGRYPSVTMLDRVEKAVTDRQTASEYVSALLDTIERDSYPSPTMLDRVSGLINILDQSQSPNGQQSQSPNGQQQE
jgi:hypothetical protein